MTGAVRSRPWRKLLRDKLAFAALAVILLYAVVGLLALFHLAAPHYRDSVGPPYSPPGTAYLLGTDVLGRSVLERVVQGTRIALAVGFVSTGIAIPIGVLFGLMAGYFRKRVDDFVVWFYTTVDSIPYILLVLALALILGKGLVSVCIAIGITSWVGACRVVRGEVIKQKELDYVQAARAIGARSPRILFLHILPNVMHLVLIQASLIFVEAVKSEVILSYLGVGVQGEPSWGVMIDDARIELIGRGAWWQFAAATGAMFALLLAFNVFNDALRDALDPKSAD
ncbi:MAG TPA: ABC transporter permease [Fibrobacteria bacterium]|nr:ABC transporter permease [Fibrobacteria bacterium]